MTWLLTILGAEVVKVENPSGGDQARSLGPDANSPFFAAVNRNKRSVTLNLNHPEGHRLFLDLLDLYEVLVEGFRPGTMERLGLGFETTSRRNPRLIHVSITGYGHDGPYRLRAGHDLNYISLSGITGITGTRDGIPGIPGVQIADIAGGSLMAMTGLLAAVIQREKTGRGQFVDTSMFHGALSLATMVLAGVEAGLDVPAPGRMLLNGRFPCYGLYRTADGRYMSLAALEFKFWQNFCLATDREDLMRERFAGPEIISELEALFASRTLDEWVELMTTSDTCCEPVLSLDEVLVSPIVEARNMVIREADGRRILASPLKLSGSPSPEDLPAPDLGAHTAEVLSQLGLSQDQLDSLAREGVI